MLNSTIAGRPTSVPGVAPQSGRPGSTRAHPPLIAARAVSRETCLPGSHEASDAVSVQRRQTGFTRRRHASPPGHPFHVKHRLCERVGGHSTQGHAGPSSVARNAGPWDTSRRGRRRSTVTRGAVRAGATFGQVAEVSLTRMTLLLAAVGATVTALLELTVGPYLKVGTAAAASCSRPRDHRDGRARSRGGLVWAFVGGLVLDVLAQRPLGSTSFALLICVGATSVARASSPAFASSFRSSQPSS